jgi:hypothetical protein
VPAILEGETLIPLSSSLTMGGVVILIDGNVTMPIGPLVLPVGGGDTESSQLTMTIDSLVLVAGFEDVVYSLNLIWTLDPLVLDAVPQTTFIGWTPALFDSLAMPVSFGSLAVHVGSTFVLGALAIPVAISAVGVRLSHPVGPLVLPVGFGYPASRRMRINELIKLDISALFSNGTVLFPLELIEGDSFGAIISTESASGFSLGFEPELNAIPANTLLVNMRLQHQGDYVMFRFIQGMVCITNQWRMI